MMVAVARLPLRRLVLAGLLCIVLLSIIMDAVFLSFSYRTSLRSPIISNGMNVKHEKALTAIERLYQSGRIVGHYGLDGWTAPSYCLETQHHLDSFFSRNIALVVFKNSYRGLAGLGDKLKFEFTRYAHDMQMATIRAFLDKIVIPWERSGFKVDIFLHTYHCESCDKELNQSYLEDLVDAFGRERVVMYNFTRAFSGPDPPGFFRYGQALAAIHVFDMIRQHMEHTGVQYRSVLLKRWDMVPEYKLSSPNLTLQNILERSLSLDYIQNHVHDPESYLIWSTTFGAKCENDLTFSIPGWQLPCYFNVVLDRESNFWNDDGFQLPSWNATALNLEYDPIQQNIPRGNSHIYRGPYGVYQHDAGKVVCRMLRTHYGGPSCSPGVVFQEFCKQHLSNNISETCEMLVTRVMKEDHDRSEKGHCHGEHCDAFALPPADDEMYTSKEELTAQCLARCSMRDGGNG